MLRHILYFFCFYLASANALGMNFLLKAKPAKDFFSFRIKYNRSISNYSRTLSAQEKSDILWKHIENTRYEKLPEFKSPGVLQTMQLLCPYHSAKVFTHPDDIMPKGRKKHIHTLGTCIRVRFVPIGNNILTGLLRQGSDAGIMRFSLAKEPGDNTCIPGMAWKCFIDKKSSVNIMAMNSFIPQEGFNIFERNFSNIVPKPPFDFGLALVNLSFNSALGLAGQKDGNTRAMSLVPMAGIEQNGTEVSEVVAPYEIIFVPTLAAQKLLPPSDQAYDFREVLEGKQIYGDNNIVLYKVMARLSKNSDPIEIGRIETSSNFIASRFGDEDISFQHQLMMLKE